MAKRQPFRLLYADEAKQHLLVIDAKFHSLIRSEIEGQLLFQPDVPTRNRKPLQRPMPLEADWELGLGPNNRFRVFYNIDPEHRDVRVLAIGIKDGSRLLIGGAEVEG